VILYNELCIQACCNLGQKANYVLNYFKMDADEESKVNFWSKEPMENNSAPSWVKACNKLHEVCANCESTCSNPKADNLARIAYSFLALQVQIENLVKEPQRTVLMDGIVKQFVRARDKYRAQLYPTMQTLCSRNYKDFSKYNSSFWINTAHSQGLDFDDAFITAFLQNVKNTVQLLW